MKSHFRVRSEQLLGLVELAKVAEKRSFTAAAADLGVSTSAVSQSIRALEARLGIRLLDRTTRSVSPTEAGRRLLERLVPLLDDLGAALASVDELRERPRGTIRLNTTSVAYETVVAPRLAELQARHPEIHLEVSIDDGFVDIVEHGFDAGIRLGEALGKDMVAVRVSDDMRVAIVASPAYLARHGTPTHPRDLASHQCIRYRTISRGAIYRWELERRRKEVVVDVEGPITTNDGRVILDAALAGLGLAYVLEPAVERELREGTLVSVMREWCPAIPGHHLYYPHRAHSAPAMQALVAILRWPAKR